MKMLIPDERFNGRKTSIAHHRIIIDNQKKLMWIFYKYSDSQLVIFKQNSATAFPAMLVERWTKVYLRLKSAYLRNYLII